MLRLRHFLCHLVFFCLALPALGVPVASAQTEPPAAASDTSSDPKAGDTDKSAQAKDKKADAESAPVGAEGQQPDQAEKPVEPPKASTASEADAKTRCAVAYESAQEARAAGELKRAQENLVVCAQSNCASFIQADCSDWLTAVQRDLPSVVFSAKRPNGEESVDATVTVNGELIAASLDGRAVSIDPGVHEFEFELDGYSPVKRRVVIRQGEKNRVVGVIFQPSDGSGDPGADEGTAQEDGGTNLRPWAYVSWGVGAGGLVGAFVLNRSARSQESDFLDMCEIMNNAGDNVLSGDPGCTVPDRDRVRDSVDKKLLWSGISLGVGIAGAVGGALLFFVFSDDQPREQQAGLQVDVSPRRDGGFATVTGTF